MFGYIKACKPELRMKEYEIYKGVYCSLCKKLGKSYGFFSRFTLSYDFTFLAILDMSFSDECCCFKQGRCAFNPLKKCNCLKDTKCLDFSAAAAMIMLYYKLNDNINDEKGIKKLPYLLLKPLFSSAHKKAMKAYPDTENAVKEYIAQQQAVEDENTSLIDLAAEPTANVMSRIFIFLSDDTSQQRVLSRLGYCIGRFIYLLDAACDFEKDIKNRSFNVFANAKGDAEFSEYKKEKIIPQLYFCANEAAKAFELLDIKRFKSILGNIIYLGLEDTFTKELNK